MKLLNTKLAAVNLKFLISEAHVAAVISYGPKTAHLLGVGI